jgi:hypothetical protein
LMSGCENVRVKVVRHCDPPRGGEAIADLQSGSAGRGSPRR